MKKEYKTLILVQLLIIILAVLSIVFLRSKYVSLVPKCVVREKLGIMCPACNGTTFAKELANFNILEAFKAHPIFFLSVVYLGLLNLVYILNVVAKKNIKIFRWWYLIIWIIILLIYTILRNLF